MESNDFFIKRTEAPKKSQYPVLQGVFNKAKKKGVNPLVMALKYADTAKAKAENLAYLKSRNVPLPSELNSIEIAILAHGERVKDLGAKIPGYKTTHPELFANQSEPELIRQIVYTENQLEKNEIPDFDHWKKLKPQTMVANEVIYDSFLDPVNAKDLLTDEAKELIKEKSKDLAEKFENFNGSQLANQAAFRGMDAAVPGLGLGLQALGADPSKLVGNFLGAKKGPSNRGTGFEWIAFDEYWKGGKRFGQPVIVGKTNENFYNERKRIVERDSGGIPMDVVTAAFKLVDEYNRPFINNPLVSAGNPAAYWKSIVDEAERISQQLQKPKVQAAVIRPAQPTETANTSILPGGRGQSQNLPEIGRISWGKDGVSWGVSNNRASMVYLLIGGLILLVLIFLLMRK